MSDLVPTPPIYLPSPPVSPPPPSWLLPPPVSVAYLLDYVTSEHNQRPKYMATVALSVEPYIDGQNIALGYQTLFDLDTAVGVQLDDVGKWVGITRFIEAPTNILFSLDLDEEDVGFDEGQWQGPHYTSQSRITRLDDDMYRLLLRARIVSNYWDGTVEGAYKAWDTLFAGTGFKVLIQDGLPAWQYNFTLNDTDQGLRGFDMAPWFDASAPRYFLNGNMSIYLILLSNAPVTAILRTLFREGYLGLDSAGVGTSHLIQDKGDIGKPIFAFDAGPETPWLTYDTPGQGTEEALIYADYGRPGTELPPGLDINSYPPTVMAGFDLGCWVKILD